MERKYSINNQIIIKTLSSGSVLIPITGKAAKEGKLYKLNDSSKMIISFIMQNGAATKTGIINHIQKNYELDNETEQEIDFFLKELHNMDILESSVDI